jgi:Protein of unknown function (DUF3137)
VETLAPLLPYLFVVGFVGSVIWSYVRNRRRRDALLTLAAARGWSYTASDSTLCLRWYGVPFGRGDSPKAVNVLNGSVGTRTFAAFDYSYETHSSDSRGGRSTTVHAYAVCVVPLPAPLGDVQVEPENALERFAGAVGLMQDVALESEDFNRRFRVSAANPKLASDVLTPRTMEYLLAVPPLAWRMEGTDLICWRSGSLDPAWVVRSVGVADRVVDSIPAFVWKDRDYDPRS